MIKDMSFANDNLFAVRLAKKAAHKMKNEIRVATETSLANRTETSLANRTLPVSIEMEEDMYQEYVAAAEWDTWDGKKKKGLWVAMAIPALLGSRISNSVARDSTGQGHCLEARDV